MSIYSYKAEASDFEPFPEGTYSFVILEVAEKKTKSTGDPMLELNLEFSHPRTNARRRVRDWLVFNTKNTWKVTDLLNALGYNIKDGDSVDLRPRDLEGKKGSALLHVEVSDYDGKERNKIFRYIPSVSLSASFPNAKNSPRPTTPQTDEFEDDIPF